LNSLRALGVLGVFAVTDFEKLFHRGDAEIADTTQRKAQISLLFDGTFILKSNVVL